MRPSPLLIMLMASVLADVAAPFGHAAAQRAPAIPALPLRPLTTLGLSGVPASTAQFTLLDLRVTTDGRVVNPYDPAQADVTLTVTTPSGTTLSVPAFWMVDFNTGGTPTDTGAWHARFTPTEPGTYTLRASSGTVQSTPQSVSVAASDAPGFIRRSATHPRFFADSQGHTFIPSGPNIAWSTGNVLADYERWFDRLAASGGNYARLWMAS